RQRADESTHAPATTSCGAGRRSAPLDPGVNQFPRNPSGARQVSSYPVVDTTVIEPYAHAHFRRTVTVLGTERRQRSREHQLQRLRETEPQRKRILNFLDRVSRWGHYVKLFTLICARW